MSSNRSNAKKSVKGRKPVKSKWTKENPHPKHIEDPTHFTIWGTPRCQGRNPNTGKQCSKRATVDGVYCSVHTDNKEMLSKRGYHRFEEKSDKVVALVRQGYTFTTAAAKVGVQPATVTAWRRKGKEEMARGEEGAYAKFWMDLEEARIYACSLVENALFSAAVGGNVSAMIRYLECRMPEVWNAKRVMEINVEAKQQLDINYHMDVSGMSDSELRSKIKEIAKAVEVSVGDHVDDAVLPVLNVEPVEVRNNG